MSIRVCTQGHVTGQRHCHCGADATQLLKDRQIPTPTHTLIARAKAAKQTLADVDQISRAVLNVEFTPLTINYA